MNHYNSLKLLGKGSYGTVFKVEHVIKNSVHALKKINAYKLKSRYDIQGLIGELKILCFHDCPYLLRCKEIFYENSHIHIVTDYANYGDLSVYIKKFKNTTRRISEKTIWLIFIKCCYGIDYLHEYNIIHRDIKPANILLSKNSNVLIADFGISKILEKKLHSCTMIGTPYYISPEMYKDKQYDKKIDIWALGCILYELVTLTVPFDANNMHALKHKVMQGKYYEDKSIHYSTDLQKMIRFLLEKDSENRPSIKDILESKIFKRKEHELCLQNENTFRKSLNYRFHEEYNTPKHHSNWDKLIHEIDKNNMNKTENIEKLQQKRLELERQEKETQRKKEEQRKQEESEKLRRAEHARKESQRKELEKFKKLKEEDEKKLWEKRKDALKVQKLPKLIPKYNYRKNEQYIQKYYNPYYGRASNFEAKYNRHRQSRNYNIINNTKLPEIYNDYNRHKIKLPKLNW